MYDYWLGGKDNYEADRKAADAVREIPLVSNHRRAGISRRQADHNWGAKDVALSLEMAQLSVDQCDDGRLVIFEDASHWVQHEETHQVNALLADFLR